MYYKSTRGRISNLKFEDALFSGYLKDGGLAMPEYIPVISRDVLKTWSKLTYPEVVSEIIGLYVSEEELPKNKRKEIISCAYKKFETPEVIKLKKLNDSLVYIAELFYGPTLAFKDLALSVIGYLFEYYANKCKKHFNIVVGTSGDTGSSAIECVRGSKWIDIIVLYPKGRCKQIQELQMITVCDDNVNCIAVDKSSDELDVPIRSCFADEEFVKVHNLCSINSINWARIMIQIAHYFYLYLSLSLNIEEEIEFIIPTGAGGNVTAGIIAKLMGLPIKLISTVNMNDIFYRTLKIGDLSQKTTLKTLAVAMDIQAPYNIERILYLTGCVDDMILSKWMEQFNKEGSVSIIWTPV